MRVEVTGIANIGVPILGAIPTIPTIPTIQEVQPSAMDVTYSQPNSVATNTTTINESWDKVIHSKSAPLSSTTSETGK